MSFMKKFDDALSFVDKTVAKVDNLVDRIPEGIQRAHDEIVGRLDPNRRHDQPEEKIADEMRKEICDSHRFKSFADIRQENFVKWHVDGHDYMYALSEMLDSAKECIFILDWWLTPELYLRRPPAYHPEWRLDRLLKRKAEQGVKIYAVVYKEVVVTMNMSSKHTKAALEALHPNIACMRHPDHIGSKDSVEYWSHHEKLVIVDNHRACVGGLDLCFGRWDTHTHPLADVHPTDFSRTLFPGQDYNNARIMDFQNVSQYVSNQVSILDYARMPWHDVHMTLAGTVVLDLAQHFIERWNEIKRRKYNSGPDSTRYDWLAFPHNVYVARDESIIRHPHRRRFEEMGKRFRQRFHLSNGEEIEEGYAPPPFGSCTAQAVRSVSDWSHGVLTEHSIQNAYIQLIREANHYIYIENQFFISSTKPGGPVVNQIAAALVERIIDAHNSGQTFKVVVVIPEVPAFPGDVKSETSLKTIMAAQYRTINRGGSSIYEELRKANIEPMNYIRFYHLRAYDRINAPFSTLIRQMEERSGVKFHEAQVALARQWVGDITDNIKNSDAPMTVLISKPQETTEGITISEKTNVQTETVPLPATETEARETIERFERGATRSDLHVSDNVVQHMMSDRTPLLNEQWAGTEEEEQNAYISELVYIHSKLMIVDDRRVILGSANLNDRSQKGDGDSEIALVVEDTDMVHSTMNGHPVMVSRFATTLRRHLYKEHLGLIPPQLCDSRHENVTPSMRCAPYPIQDTFGAPEDDLVADPLCDQTWELWTSTAKRNRDIFTEIFRPVPTNLVRDWGGYENYVPKVKTGHVAPDVPIERVKDRLSSVRGALVEAPIDFLIDQKDFVEGPDWLGLNPTLPIYI